MEILNTYSNSVDGLYILQTIIFIIISLIFLYGTFESIKNKKIANATGCLVVTLALGFVVYISFQLAMLPTKIVKHEVIIKDMDKFDYDKYKIVDQRGRIFTVEEIGE